MLATHCPLCYSELELMEVAPCMDCGHNPVELQHFWEGVHHFTEYRVFGDLTLILCNFCEVDFSSYDPTYFGLPEGARIGIEYMTLIRHVQPIPVAYDHVCPKCQRRLAFLTFVAAAREFHGGSSSAE